MSDVVAPRDENHVYNLLHQPNVDWNTFLGRVQSHPEEVQWPSKQRSTVLLDVVSKEAPAHVVRAVAGAFPRAIAFASYSIYPEGTIGTREWENQVNPLPLQVAIEARASPDVIRVLLQELVRFRPNIVGARHAATYFDQYKGFHSVEVTRIFLEEIPIEPLTEWNDDAALNWKERAFSFDLDDESSWEKLRLFLMKITTGTTREEELNGRSFHVLHAFLQFVCRCWLIPGYETLSHLRTFYGFASEWGELGFVTRALETIKRKLPDEFHARNGDGSLPIHIAATLSHRYVRNGNYDSSLGNGRLNWNVYKRYSDIIAEYPLAIVGFLLRENPESVGMLDGRGRLPLYIAMENDSPCWKLLAEKEPRAVSTRCMETRMFPFQIAAHAASSPEWMESSENSNAEWLNPFHQYESTSNIYSLLRQAPEVLQVYCAPNDPTLDSPEYKEIQHNNLRVAQLQARNASLKRKLDRRLVGEEESATRLRRNQDGERTVVSP